MARKIKAKEVPVVVAPVESPRVTLKKQILDKIAVMKDIFKKKAK